MVCRTLLCSADAALVPVLACVAGVDGSVVVRNCSCSSALVTRRVTSIVVNMLCGSCVRTGITSSITSVVPLMCAYRSLCGTDGTYVPVTCFVLGVGGRPVMSCASCVSTGVTLCVTRVGIYVNALACCRGVTGRTYVPVVRTVSLVFCAVGMVNCSCIVTGVALGIARAVVNVI